LAPDLWKKVGADGCPSNAIESITLAEKLIKETEVGRDHGK
jgi:hypothetical protein